MDANRTSPGARQSELTSFWLGEACERVNRKLAWVNSVCILFLLIGMLGSKTTAVQIKPLPVTDEIVPAIIEPLPPSPQRTEEKQTEPSTEAEKLDTPQVVVVTPETPSINFAVPTIGNLVASTAIAQAPPLHPMQAPAPIKRLPASLDTTGTGGERPQPPYPKIALDQGQQGTVVLLLTADHEGKIISAEVKESSGFPVLDRSALDYVRRHWALPRNATTNLFETSITYRIVKN